jgi:hypothetical protein
MAQHNDMPPAPLTELGAAAVGMHEMFQAYVAAGFTEAQAMQIVCAVLTAGINQLQGDD